MTKNKTYDIWSEGYAATGEYGTATFHGAVTASSFKEACKKLAKKDKNFAADFDPKSMTYWGCRLYKSEKKARKIFG